MLLLGVRYESIVWVIKGRRGYSQNASVIVALVIIITIIIIIIFVIIIIIIIIIITTIIIIWIDSVCQGLKSKFFVHFREHYVGNCCWFSGKANSNDTQHKSACITAFAIYDVETQLSKHAYKIYQAVQ